MKLKGSLTLNAISLLIFSLTICAGCSKQAEKFSTFDFDPLRIALKNNKITHYESFVILADSILKTHSYQVDKNGNLLSKDALEGIFDGSHNTFKYDSSGHLIEAAYRSDTEVIHSVTYKLLPKERKVIERWEVSQWLHRTRILVYNDDLDKIVEKIDVDGITDTTSHLRIKYYHGKIISVSDKRKQIIIYDYDEFEKLRTIKRVGSRNDYEIDYISAMTGLVDSTQRRLDGNMILPIYYTYYNTKHHKVTDTIYKH